MTQLRGGIQAPSDSGAHRPRASNMPGSLRSLGRTQGGSHHSQAEPWRGMRLNGMSTHPLLIHSVVSEPSLSPTCSAEGPWDTARTGRALPAPIAPVPGKRDQGHHDAVNCLIRAKIRAAGRVRALSVSHGHRAGLGAGQGCLPGPTSQRSQVSRGHGLGSLALMGVGRQLTWPELAREEERSWGRNVEVRGSAPTCPAPSPHTELGLLESS